MVELNHKQKLERFYRETIYSVFIGGNKIGIAIDKPVPDTINKILNKNTSAVLITAWNPRSETLSLQENNQRNTELEDILLTKNYQYYKAIGQENVSDTKTGKKWPDEEGFCILGLNELETEQLAVDFHQNAYVLLEYGKTAILKFSKIWHD